MKKVTTVIMLIVLTTITTFGQNVINSGDSLFVGNESYKLGDSLDVEVFHEFASREILEGRSVVGEYRNSFLMGEEIVLYYSGFYVEGHKSCEPFEDFTWTLIFLEKEDQKEKVEVNVGGKVIFFELNKKKLNQKK